MTRYTIQVLNRSGRDKSYVVFMQPPASSSPGGVTPVYTNAWATFENITDGGWDSVTYTPEDLAQASEEPPAPRVLVAEGVYVPGQVIEPPQDANVATVDFTQRPETTATVTQDPHGDFSVAYS